MTNEVKRGPGRPPKDAIMNRGEDTMIENTAENVPTSPVSRGLREAALRAEELRSKMRANDTEIAMYDEFYIDPRDIPEGWDYNWKRESIAGMTDEENMIEMRSVGWEPVDSARHPDKMPIGYKGAVRRKGMILMERPKEISDIAKDRELRMARQVVADKERSLGITPNGTFERDPRRTGITKSYQPMEVPSK